MFPRVRKIKFSPVSFEPRQAYPKLRHKSRNAPNLCRIRTYAKYTHNSFGIRTYKIIRFKVL
jgi:hypothetical protein